VHLHDLNAALNTVQALFKQEPSLASNPELAGLEGRIYREIYGSTNNSDDLTKARAAYRRAAEANPSDYYCAVNAASLALLARDEQDTKMLLERALNAARQAQSRRPASYWADFSVGEILIGQGDIEGALAEYRRGIERQPASPPRDREAALGGVRRMAKLRNLSEETLQQIEALLL
jgi:tetratricopeptide (TPR) repeat protein